MGKRLFNVPRVGKRLMRLIKSRFGKKSDVNSEESYDSYLLNNKRLFNVPRVGK